MTLELKNERTAKKLKFHAARVGMDPVDVAEQIIATSLVQADHQMFGKYKNAPMATDGTKGANGGTEK